MTTILSLKPMGGDSYSFDVPNVLVLIETLCTLVHSVYLDACLDYTENVTICPVLVCRSEKRIYFGLSKGRHSHSDYSG